MKQWILVLLLLWGHGVELLAQERIKVACVGNSITEGPGRDNKNSYPLLMQKTLGDAYHVRNFGVSGSTLLRKGDLPYRDQPSFKDAVEFQPDILIIKLGTNDSKPQNWVHKEGFFEDYVELINAFREVMPDKALILVCLPVPVFEDNWGITERVIMKEVTPLIKKVARATGTQTVDLHKPFAKKKGLFPDGVHPNAEGNAQMAEILADKIRK